MATLNTGGTPGATINNNGTFDLQGDVTFLGGLGGTNVFNNVGTLTKSAGAGLASANGDVNNSGTVNANFGTLSFGGSFTQSGGLTRLNGGSISTTTTLLFNGGALDAVGGSTITGSVNNAGATVRPGMSPGLLTITGAYTQGALGVLDIELGGAGGVPGTDFDVLAITGSATLGGTLNVLSFGGFTPVADDSFQVMTYASFTGDFATKNGLDISTPPLTATPQANFYLLQVPAPAMADLAVTKTDSPDPILLGSGDITYTVTVTNNGPDAASNVVLTDTLPGSVTFVSATPSQGTCSGPVMDVLTCDLGTINNAANAIVTMVVTPTMGGMISNTASISATEADPTPGNNSDTETTTVNTPQMADLAVTKADSPDPAVVGQDITYTVTVSNGGPDAASNVTLTDTLPAGVAFVSATPSPGTCSTPPVAGVLTCNLGTIANGAMATVDIVITPLAAGALNNTASAAATESDPDGANNTAMQGTTVNQATTSTALVSSVNPSVFGQSVTFTATVTVNAPGAGTPTGDVNFFDGPTPLGTGTVTGGVATFATSALNVGMHTITAAYVGDVNFTTSTSAPLTQTVNQAATTTSVVSSANPSVFGQPVVFTATVTVNAPGAGTPAGLVDFFDGGNFIGGGALNAMGQVAISTSALGVGAHSITATYAGNFNFATSSSSVLTQDVSQAATSTAVLSSLNPSNFGQSVTFTATVTATAPGAGTRTGTVDFFDGAALLGSGTVSITGQATFATSALSVGAHSITASYGGDTNFTASTSPAITQTVNGVADLAVTKTDAPDPAVVGQDITYTLTVTNNGPDTANSVTLTDMLPAAGIAFVSATPSQGTCAAPAGNVLTCNLGVIANAAAASVTIVVTPTAAGALINMASATTADVDPAVGNNSDTESTTVNQAATTTTVMSSLNPSNSGDTVTFTATVSVSAPGAGIPTGSADFFDGVTSIGSGAVNATGQATLAISTLTPGAHSITAVYFGDTNFSASTSPAITQFVNAVADISVTKVDAVDPVVVGQNVSYTVTVANAGPDPATSVSLMDAVPANTTFVSLTALAGWTCITPPVGGTGTVTCTRASLGSGANEVFTLVVNTAAGAVPSVSNTATVSAAEPDSNAANNSDTETTTVNPPTADLAVSKSDLLDPVTEGQNVTYTITVTNGGPGPASNATLNDPLPAGATFVNLGNLPAGWTCVVSFVPAPGVLNCTNPLVANGANDVFTLVVATTAAAVPSISNTATVSAVENDPNTANNSDTETTTVNPLTADLAVTKTDTLDPVTEGQNVTYTITVTNAGPEPATSVSLMDAVPANTTFVSFTAPAGWTSTTPAVGGTGTVTATNANLAAGTPHVFTLVVATTGAAVPSISNTAAVSATEADPTPANNSDTETTTVNPLTADLAVTKTDAPDPVNAGQNVTYTITVTNAGPDPATSVSLMDAVPANTTFVSLTASAGWTCITPPVGGTGMVTCTRASLASGANEVFTLVVATSAASAPSISNTATVSAAENDPNSGNNSDTESTAVNLVADISVTKADAADPVNVGQNIVYTVTVANAGPDAATAVMLTDTLPAAVTFVSAVASQGACGAPVGVMLTCNLGTITSGANATVQITVTAGALAAPSVTNMASATTTSVDPNNANDSDAETTTVNPVADLAITKTDSPDPVSVGSNITYTIQVTNNGPSPATGVTVSDPIPAGLTFVSATGPAGVTCMQAGGTITCTLAGMLNSGANVTATVIVTTTAAAVPSVSNTATVSSMITDPNPANNSATATTTVSATPPANDFSLVVQPINNNVVVGQNGTFQAEVTSLPAGSNFANPVDLMCISLTGACTVAPHQLASGIPSGTVMITVRTADLLGSAPPAPSAPGIPPAAPLVALWTFLASLMLVSLGVIGKKTKQRRLAHCMSFGLALLVASFAIGQSACAASPGRQVAGPYSVTVTATSGTVSHSATVTLNVTDR